MTETPIERRTSWKIHEEAREDARARGLCFACQTEEAFRAVDKAFNRQPQLALHPHVCSSTSCPNHIKAKGKA